MNPTVALLLQLPPLVGFQNVLHGSFSWLHQTVIAKCAHRGCRPQPSRANGGIPLSLKAHPGVVPDGLAPAGILGTGMAAPWCASGASSQGLSTPQSAKHSNQMTVLSVAPGRSVAQVVPDVQMFFAVSEKRALAWSSLRGDRRAVFRGLTFELTGAEQIDGIWARLF